MTVIAWSWERTSSHLELRELLLEFLTTHLAGRAASLSCLVLLLLVFRQRNAFWALPEAVWQHSNDLTIIIAYLKAH